jgi:hypothetical protein
VTCCPLLLVPLILGSSPARASGPWTPPEGGTGPADDGTQEDSDEAEQGETEEDENEDDAETKAHLDVPQTELDLFMLKSQRRLVLSYAGVAVSLLGLEAMSAGASQASSAGDADSFEEGAEDVAEGAATSAGGGGLGALGMLTAAVGTSSMTYASIEGARLLKEREPAHNMNAGWVAVGGLGAAGAGVLTGGASPVGSVGSTIGGTVAASGLLTALVAGHVQHVRNRQRKESLAALHPRKPGPLAPTLAYH